jgi:hypothetical protein
MSYQETGREKVQSAFELPKLLEKNLTVLKSHLPFFFNIAIFAYFCWLPSGNQTWAGKIYIFGGFPGQHF